MKRPDNSFAFPSKKDNVRGETHYALANSLKHLHLKFIHERPSFSVSVSTFCRARPATVKIARFTQRHICHANFVLIIDAAKVLPKSTTETINLSDEEIGTKLNNITTSHITYQKWETTQEEHKGKLFSHVNLIKKLSDRHHFISELQESLPAFKAHCERVQMQYEQIHHMKDTLRPGKDICVQLDYAKNWSATYLREISSAYYDKKWLRLTPW